MKCWIWRAAFTNDWNGEISSMALSAARGKPSVNCMGFHTDSKGMKWSQFAADKVSQKSLSVADHFGAKETFDQSASSQNL
jgi:hypothetical protein